MNSKSMSNYALMFLIFTVAVICYELFTGRYIESTWFLLITSTIFNVSSAIKRDLESLINQDKG